MQKQIGVVDARMHSGRSVRAQSGQQHGDQALGRRLIGDELILEHATGHHRRMGGQHGVRTIVFEVMEMVDRLDDGRRREVLGFVEQRDGILFAHGRHPAHFLVAIELLGVERGASVTEEDAVVVVFVPVVVDDDQTQFGIERDEWSDETIGRNGLEVGRKEIRAVGTVAAGSMADGVDAGFVGVDVGPDGGEAGGGHFGQFVQEEVVAGVDGNEALEVGG